MDRLGKYQLSGQMSNKDSGYSVWCFGQRDGQEYFIKEFLSPKYPYEDPYSPPELIERKKKECRVFEARKRELYRVLNEYSDGNSVRVRDFFRVGSKYYMATPKITEVDLTIDSLAVMSDGEKRRICAIVAHAVAALHSGGLVHADLKPANILFSATKERKNCTAKIIDFDSSFLESAPPSPDEEIVGDQIYFSPEAWLVTYGYEARLTCKMDVFALGILFHQYYTGVLPGFDPEGEYPGKAVAQGMELKLDSRLPEDIAQLIGQMLDADPEMRPSAMEVFRRLMPAPDHKEEPVPNSGGMNNWFVKPGDL